MGLEAWCNSQSLCPNLQPLLLRPARFERAIFGSGGRRLIHWATGAKTKNDENKMMNDELHFIIHHSEFIV